MRLACIGSREVPSGVADACREMGMELARAGYTIVTGATPGRQGQDEWADWADGAFASGAWYANPARLVVCLPWLHFPRGSSGPPDGVKVAYAEEHPEWEEAARQYWEEQRSGPEAGARERPTGARVAEPGEAKRSGPEAGPWLEVRRAQRLRYMCSAGIVLQSQLVLAWPGAEAEGTRFAMGFAEWRKTPLIDLSLTSWREVLAALLAQAGSASTQ